MTSRSRSRGRVAFRISSRFFRADELGGIEFAAELVEAMNIYRAGRNDSSLKAFVDDLRGRFREAHGVPGGRPSS